MSLSPGNVAAIADNQGTFAFANVALQEGANQFTVNSTGKAGNTSAFSVTIVRAETFGEPLIAPAEGRDDTAVGEIMITGSVVGAGDKLDSQRDQVDATYVDEVGFDNTEALKGTAKFPSDGPRNAARLISVVPQGDRSDDLQAVKDRALDPIAPEMTSDLTGELLNTLTDLAFSGDWSAPA